MKGPDETPKKWPATLPLSIGFGALFLLVFGLGLWSISVEISGAVQAPGTLRVDIDRQVVQHPSGGVVVNIRVREGDLVRAGDVLIELDQAQITSEIAILEQQMVEIAARKSRLIAERNGLSEVQPLDLPEALSLSADLVAEIFDGQVALFEARQDNFGKEIALHKQRIVQIEAQIDGLAAQKTAAAEQYDLVLAEHETKASLYDRGLAKASDVTALKREMANMRGEIGALSATIAEFREIAAAIELQILQLTTSRREAATTELRDLSFRSLDILEQHRAKLETKARLEIRAPIDGIVHGNSVVATQSVIRPAEPILYIVPQDRNLVVVAQVQTRDIDVLSVGQETLLKFDTMGQSTGREIIGHVTQISADAHVDEKSGRAFYRVVIAPDIQRQELVEQGILTGMPVDAFFRTYKRTPLEYLTKPLTDYFSRAFLES